MRVSNVGCPLDYKYEDCNNCLFYDADNNLCEYDRNLSEKRNTMNKVSYLTEEK